MYSGRVSVEKAPILMDVSGYLFCKERCIVFIQFERFPSEIMCRVLIFRDYVEMKMEDNGVNLMITTKIILKKRTIDLNYKRCLTSTNLTLFISNSLGNLIFFLL